MTFFRETYRFNERAMRASKRYRYLYWGVIVAMVVLGSSFVTAPTFFGGFAFRVGLFLVFQTVTMLALSTVVRTSPAAARVFKFDLDELQ